jgi:arsenate reductase-like glutaredoxin family protein
MRAQVVFDAKGIKISEAVEARKQKIEGDNAWAILGSAKELVVGRGKKFQVYDPKKDDKAAVLKVCLGRTGNLRAPTLKMGDRVVVGFNDDMYEQFVG